MLKSSGAHVSAGALRVHTNDAGERKVKRSQPPSSPFYPAFRQSTQPQTRTWFYSPLYQEKAGNCSVKYRFFFFSLLTHSTGHTIVHKSFRTRSTWTDQYDTAINIFAFAENFFLAVQPLFLFQLRLRQGLAVGADFRDFFMAFRGRSHQKMNREK